MERDFRIEIKNLADMGKEFIKTWRDVEQGKASEAPIERVYFEDIKAFVKILTPRRIEMLKVLHKNGPLTIRALSRVLDRNYKNVHQDIQLLKNIGIVEETDSGLLAAPFDKIVAEIRLAA
jgi:predicted transcriptional regulator